MPDAWRDGVKPALTFLGLVGAAVVLPIWAAATSSYPKAFALLALVGVAATFVYISPEFPRRHKVLWQGISLGIAIEIALIASYQLHLVRVHKLADTGADLFMSLYNWSKDEKNSVPFVFVDIDDESVGESWEHEGRVSRGELRDAITKILKVSPALLIVDVDLSYPHLGDCGNVDVFSAICENRAVRNPDAGVILAWMTDDPAAPATGGKGEQSDRCEVPIAELRNRAPCILEAEDGLGEIYWTNPIVKADADLVVRRWPRCDSQADDGSLFTECERKGLSIAGLAAERTDKRGDLKSKLTSPGAPEEFRIVYTLPWAGGEAPPTLADGTPVLTRVSAQVVTRAHEDETALPAEWAERIVIIGGSYGDAQDIHQTPIGPMPGSMIIANAIHSLHQFGPVKEPAPLGKLLAASIAIISVAVVLHFCEKIPKLPKAAPMFIALIVTITIMMIESYVVLELRFLPEGIWLDATLPCIGVILHHWFEAGHSGHEHRQNANGPAEQPQEDRTS